MMNIKELSKEIQEEHEFWMKEAIKQAHKAQALGEVPIGAVVVKDGQMIGQAYNLRETAHRATAHAELLAIEDANKNFGAWRLEGASLYVTLEPCPMCAGAIINARIKDLIYGAQDPKAGCVGSLYNLLEDSRFNHQVQVIYNVLSDETGGLLSDFFKDLRTKKKKQRIYPQEK